MIKLIAMDMDGTLLQPDHTIARAEADAIRDAQTQGITCVIATGRMLPSALPYAEQLGMRGPIMCCNGAHVAMCETRETVFMSAMDASQAVAVTRWADARGLYVQTYQPEMYYFKEPCSYSDDYAISSGVVGQTAPSWPMDVEAIKMLFVAPPSEIQRVLPQLRDEFPGLSLVCSVPKFIEVTSKAANKGAALAALAERMGIKREEVMAIGDSGNDEPMLSWAEHSVAMGNATPDILALCRYKARSNADNGVAHAIRSIALCVEGNL